MPITPEATGPESRTPIEALRGVRTWLACMVITNEDEAVRESCRAMAAQLDPILAAADALLPPTVQEDAGWLDELERLLKEATPAPWAHRQAGVKSGDGTEEFDWIADAPTQHRKIILGRGSLYGGSRDYALVSAAVNALPRLLAIARSGSGGTAWLAPAIGRLEQFAVLDDEDKHGAASEGDMESRHFFAGRAAGLRTAINYIKGCGAIDCVNACDGDFTHETCPNAAPPPAGAGE